MANTLPATRLKRGMIIIQNGDLLRILVGFARYNNSPPQLSPQLIDRACQVAHRDLSQDEWTDLVGDSSSYSDPC